MEAVKPAPPASSRSADNRLTGRRPQFYSAKSHASIWRALRTALVRAEGVILVVGQEGTGKSSLIKRLAGMIPDNRDLVMIQSADLPDEEFLAQLIAAATLLKDEAGQLAPVEPDAPEFPDSADFPLIQPPLTMQDLLDAMEERVAMGRKLVLAVDQAHLLNPQHLNWLDMLARFSSEGVKPVQLVLVGLPALRELLESESGSLLKEQIVGSCEVTPLTRGEVWGYLAFQLDRSVGWPVRVSWFGWVEIYGYSQGIPLKIDLLMKRILPLVKQRNAKVINRALVRLAMTMGRPMGRGSFFGNSPKVRAAMAAGGLTFLAGMGYVAGVFDSGASRSDPPVVITKGSSGENSAYVRLVQPDATSKTDKANKADKPEKTDKVNKADKSDKPEKIDKPDKPDKPEKAATVSRETKPPEEKGEEKPGIPKKRYWEPNLSGRPEFPPAPPQTTPPEKAEPVTVPSVDKPSNESPLPPRTIPDPESFRKRYQSAKALSGIGAFPPETPPMDPVAGEMKKGLPVPLSSPRPVVRPVGEPDASREPTRDISRESVKEEESPLVERKESARKPPPPPPPPPAPILRPPVATPPVVSASGMESDEAANEREEGDVTRFKAPIRIPPERKKIESEPKPPKAATKGSKPVGVAENLPLPHVTGVATERSFRGVGKVYVVQIGSYATQENADQLRRNLSGAGRDPYVHLYERKQRRLFSVRMNYRNREIAERMARTIQQQEGLPTKVLELNYD
ncbi:MAG: AAA family ATPase [Magnetococcales bacterium]|nr:AAA family ATPase [Magnetococcales bacterium]